MDVDTRRAQAAGFLTTAAADTWAALRRGFSRRGV
jgi:hypothetical protein